MNYTQFMRGVTTFLANYSLVMDFVAYRHRVEPLDNIIFFPTKRFSGDGIEHVLQQRLLIPQVIVHSDISPSLGRFVNTNSIALIFVARVVEQRILWQVSMTLHRHPFIPIVCVSQRIPNTEDMKEFFEHFAYKNMINLLLMYRENGAMVVRTFSSFPVLRIIPLDANNFESFLWCRYENVEGYNFKVSVYYDPPMAYMIGNQSELHGVIGYMIRLFINSVNGTISVVRYPIDANTRRHIDINANLILRAGAVHSHAEPSYPLFRTRVCLVLPVESEIPLGDYFQHAFDRMTWILISLAFLGITLLFCAIGYWYGNRRDHGRHALFALRVFLNHPVVAYDEISTKVNILVGYFGVLGIVLETLYAGSLTSMLSSKVLMSEICSAEAFLKTDLRIMTLPQDRELYFDSALLPPALIPRLYPVEDRTLIQHLLKPNVSFAYLMTKEKWSWYQKTQKYLQHPYFRIANRHKGNFCTPPLHQILSLKQQSPFKRSINMLIMRLQQYGFIEHWLEEAKPTKTLQRTDEPTEDFEPLTLVHFEFGWYILGFGWSLAFIVFLGEQIVWRRRKILRNRWVGKLWNALGRNYFGWKRK